MMTDHRIAIGGHLSTSDGFRAMGEVAHAMDATTFAFFTRNPRGGTAKAIDPDDARALQAFMAEHGFSRLVAHAPYTMNLCSDKPETREFARRVLSEDLQRMELLPGNYYNFHPEPTRASASSLRRLTTPCSTAARRPSCSRPWRAREPRSGVPSRSSPAS